MAEPPRVGTFTPRAPLGEMAPCSSCDGFPEHFNLRIGPNYSKKGLKAPSGPALFEFAGMDVVHSADPILDISSRFKFPPRFTGAPHNGVPEYVVLNMQVPVGKTDLINPKLTGESMNIVLYFAMTEALKNHLASPASAPPAVKLFSEYCCIAPTIPWNKGKEEPGFRGRFKLMALVEGLPKVLNEFNGKPVLLTKSSSVTLGENYLEVDCNLRCWNVVARKAVTSVWGDVKGMKMEIGMTIEARDDDEMPEQILGCCQVSQMDWGVAREG